MKYINEKGQLVTEDSSQDCFLKFIYSSMAGRVSLKLLTRPWVSKLGGAFLSTPFSKCFISSFIQNNHIPMADYEKTTYKSYNDFFTRKIKAGKRPIPEDENVLFSPCDCKVSVYPIYDNTTFVIKDTLYTVESLLKHRKLAKRFRDGYAVVCRLTVDDYHRYSYIDDGEKSYNYFIPGIYHTVNPIANDYAAIYSENAREYTMMKTKHFGNVVQMEVGALMVGRIKNHQGMGPMKRGTEKGYFEFGGSTIVLLFEKNRVNIDQELLKRTEEQCETKVKLGQRIGYKK
ncbi:MAG: phosphatidylserine decarboxylase [Anaerostipes sp.]|nr:phosphatidylserine decarboxylase [Anaerostipes sp.]